MCMCVFCWDVVPVCQLKQRAEPLPPVGTQREVRCSGHLSIFSSIGSSSQMVAASGSFIRLLVWLDTRIFLHTHSSLCQTGRVALLWTGHEPVVTLFLLFSVTKLQQHQWNRGGGGHVLRSCVMLLSVCCLQLPGYQHMTYDAEADYVLSPHGSEWQGAA